MTMSVRLLSRSRAARSDASRFWKILFLGLDSARARLVRVMYASRAAFFVVGGCHFETVLNGGVGSR